jgi:galactokinase
MYNSHFGLKNLYEVSCEELDFLVDFTMGYKEVIGSRMMGGGFGGCTINLIEENFINDFIKLISLAYLNKFNIELNVMQVNIGDGVLIKNS